MTQCTALYLACFYCCAFEPKSVKREFESEFTIEPATTRQRWSRFDRNLARVDPNRHGTLEDPVEEQIGKHLKIGELRKKTEGESKGARGMEEVLALAW